MDKGDDVNEEVHEYKMGSRRWWWSMVSVMKKYQFFASRRRSERHRLLSFNGVIIRFPPRYRYFPA